jgi:acid phosphatase (class A)
MRLMLPSLERSRHVTRLLIAALLFALPAFAAEQPYLAPAQVDLLRLLPPPPSDGPELAQVLEAQRARTPERAAQAAADAQETVFAMFRPVLGERFVAAAAPLATALFDRLGATEESVVGPAKNGFRRKRPFLESPDVQPVVPTSKSGSYPSGHATRVTLEGIVLASMLPERRDAIFARMTDYARSRVIGGVHYPSDIEAGARAGTAAAAVLFDDPAFEADYGPARQQLRAALGLSE